MFGWFVDEPGRWRSIQRYTRITFCTTAPLHNIFDTVVRQKQNFKHEKYRIQSCQFGMHHQGLTAAKLTWSAYVDGRKRENIAFWNNACVCVYRSMWSKQWLQSWHNNSCSSGRSCFKFRRDRRQKGKVGTSIVCLLMFVGTLVCALHAEFLEW